MRPAFLFPGQGSQYVGMGADLAAESDIARQTYQEADDIMEFALSDLSFSGPEDRLKQTQFTQPAIFTHSVAIYRILKDMGAHPGITAGHSLGEYSALVGCGALSFADALRLVKHRAFLMQQAGHKQPGKMAAVIGLSGETVMALCKEAGTAGVVVPANFNLHDQIVISGSVAGVSAAMDLANEAGAKRVVELVVSGAFHSPLMAQATDELAKALRETNFQTPECPLVSNVSASPIEDVEAIRDLLIQQLTNPVRWVESIEKMLSLGHAEFYELGPGKVLTGLLRRLDRTASCMALGKFSDFEKIQSDQLI